MTERAKRSVGQEVGRNASKSVGMIAAVAGAWLAGGWPVGLAVGGGLWVVILVLEDVR